VAATAGCADQWHVDQGGGTSRDPGVISDCSSENALNNGASRWTGTVGLVRLIASEKMPEMSTLLSRLFVLVAVAMLPAIALQAYNEIDLRRTREVEVQDEALGVAKLAAAEQMQIVQGIHQALIALSEHLLLSTASLALYVRDGEAHHASVF
jgi:hypothetical protein